jgi:hypothetical protein
MYLNAVWRGTNPVAHHVAQMKSEEKMNSRFVFTKSEIAKLPAPEAGQRYIARDEQCPGLCVLVSTNDKKFFVYGRPRGAMTPVRVFIHGDLTISQVRAEAAKIKGQLAQGHNPIEEARAKRQEEQQRRRDEMSLKELFTAYITARKNDPRRPMRSWSNLENIFSNHVSKWESRPASKITIEQVRQLHNATLGVRALVAPATMLAGIGSKKFNV